MLRSYLLPCIAASVLVGGGAACAQGSGGHAPVEHDPLTGPPRQVESDWRILAPAGRLTVTAHPQRICHDQRHPGYLNFDLILHNRTERPATISELRAFVLGPHDEVVERRIVWQQSLGLLGPHRTVTAGGEGAVYNPVLFHTAAPGRRIRYELDFEEDGQPSSELIVVPGHASHAHALSFP